MEDKFKQFLLQREIPFEEDETCVWVSNSDLIEWEDELLLAFPDFEFENENEDEHNKGE